MLIVQRGVSMCMFFMMAAFVGSTVSWAEDITTESDQSIVVMEVQEGQRVQLICKTEIGKKTWIFVTAPGLAPGITYVMPRDEYCQAHNGFLFPLEGDSTDMYFSESPSTNRIDLGSFDPTSLLPLAITTAIGQSSHTSEVVQTIVLMPQGFTGRDYDQDDFLIDPNALKDDSSRNKTLARRTEGQKNAYIIHIDSGMIMGIALRCYDKGNLVYAGFKNFSEAVSSGNNFLSYRELPGMLEGFPANSMEVTEVQSEGDLNACRGCTNIQKENIRISVCQAEGTNYYNLLIYISNDYRITLYKSCNTCPRFTFDAALSHAQQLVNALQKWE